MGKKKKLSRRNFLKSVGIGSASLALMGTKVRPGFCQDKKRYMYAGPSEINTIDPAGHMDVGRSTSRLNFYDGLLRWRDNPPKLTPNLALSYEASAGAKKWIFHLRKEALFHNGSEVTAEDVVYTMERLLALGTGAAGVFAPILDKGATRALDKYTVEFQLKKPFAAFAGLTHFLHVLNKKVVQAHEKDGDWGSKWLSTYGTRLGKDGVGTGSYTYEMYDPAVGYDGIKFKDHFLGWDDPHMERIGYRSVHEQAARVLALMKGDFHGEHGYLSYEQLEKVKTSPKMKVVVQPTMRLFYPHLHCQKPPTSDVHFRRALCYAFDYESWINDIQHNMVERNIGPVPNPMWGSLDPGKEFGYEYNLDKAKEELKKCTVDWKKCLPIEQATILGMSATLEGAQILQAGLNRIGVKTTIAPKSWPTLTEQARLTMRTPIIGSVKCLIPRSGAPGIALLGIRILRWMSSCTGRFPSWIRRRGRNSILKPDGSLFKMRPRSSSTMRNGMGPLTSKSKGFGFALLEMPTSGGGSIGGRIFNVRPFKGNR